MPLYEYRCVDCGYHYEKIQHFGAEPETECPQCKGKVERPLTAPAFQFKGSGWYVSDYSGKSAAPQSAASESAAPCANAGSCGATACPAAAAAAKE